MNSGQLPVLLALGMKNVLQGLFTLL